jgi:hypothetical protein
MTQQAAPLSKSSGFREILQNPYFLRLWIAQLISQSIQNAANYASIVLVGEQAGASTFVGGVVIAFSLPIVLFGIPAGVLVDRMNKGVVLWSSNILRALMSFGFIISLIIAPKAFVPIYLLTFFISIVGQFFAPAEGAAIPLLVKRDELVPALSLFNVTFTLAQALGFILLGPVMLNFAIPITFHFGHEIFVFTRMHQLFLFIGILYIICAGLTASLPTERLNPIAGPGDNTLATHRVLNVWRGIVEAWNFVRHDLRLSISLIEVTLGGTIISIVGVLARDFAITFMKRPIEAVTLTLFLPAGIGLVAGAAIMPRFVNKVGLAVTETLGIICTSSSILLLTFSHWSFEGVDRSNWFNILSISHQ